MPQHMTPQEEDIALAGEYVLRLLPDEAGAAFEARLEQEPALRARVVDWDEALLPLTDGIKPIKPPKSLRRKLERELFPAPRSKGNPVGFLAGAVVGLVVVTMLFALVPVPEAPVLAEAAEPVAPPADPNPPRAVLQSVMGDFTLTAIYDPETGILSVSRVSDPAGQAQAYQLWMIPNGGAQTYSVARLPVEDTGDVTVPEPLRETLADATLLVTREPSAAEVAEAPTGPVMAAGAMSDQ